jgi:medium-chain acyl-[acyl-carrier-protein] hydrolase
MRTETTAGTAAGRWLPFAPPSGTPVRLFCLPHAGAGASAYRAWSAKLPRRIGAVPIQPPGRETRLWEPAFTSAGPLVNELAGALSGLLGQPYAVFGHSVGALTAFELLRAIRRRGLPAPVHLFVAGRPAPQLPYTGECLRDTTVEQLAELLGRLGGTSEDVLRDHGLLSAIAPAFRADFAVNETYSYQDEAPLDVPLTVFGGTADPRATREQLAAWRAQSTREFRLTMVPGGHFAVLENEIIGRTIAEALAPWT